MPEARQVVAREDGSDEEALVAALRAGEDWAYRRMVGDHGGRMLAVTRRILRSEEDARDAVQEAFIQAFRAIDRFQGTARLSTWLHRIAVNAALMRIRSRKARPEEPIEPFLPTYREDGHVETPFVAWPDAPEERLDRRRLCGLVRSAIDRLPENYRTVLVLRDLEELDTADVAEMLGITANAVKIRVHRARQALRTLLDPQLKETLA